MVLVWRDGPGGHSPGPLPVRAQIAERLEADGRYTAEEVEAAYHHLT
jgi:hypothetical protein